MGNGVEDDKGQKLKSRKGSSPGQDLSERYSGGRGGKGAKRSGNLDARPPQNPRWTEKDLTECSKLYKWPTPLSI